MSEKVIKTPISGGIEAVEQEIKAMGLSGENVNTYLASTKTNSLVINTFGSTSTTTTTPFGVNFHI